MDLGGTECENWWSTEMAQDCVESYALVLSTLNLQVLVLERKVN
jgi:hypothetical protein